MAVTERAETIQATERAIGLLTGFALTVQDETDLVAAQEFYRIIDDLADSLRNATTPEQIDAARSGFANALIMLISIMNPLIERCADNFGIDKFVFLQGLAQDLYGSIS